MTQTQVDLIVGDLARLCDHLHFEMENLDRK